MSKLNAKKKKCKKGEEHQNNKSSIRTIERKILGHCEGLNFIGMAPRIRLCILIEVIGFCMLVLIVAVAKQNRLNEERHGAKWIELYKNTIRKTVANIETVASKEAASKTDASKIATSKTAVSKKAPSKKAASKKAASKKAVSKGTVKFSKATKCHLATRKRGIICVFFIVMA